MSRDTYDDGVRGDAFFNDLARRIRTCYCSISSASSDLTSAAANKMKGQQRGCYPACWTRSLTRPMSPLVPDACDQLGAVATATGRGTVRRPCVGAKRRASVSFFVSTKSALVPPDSENAHMVRFEPIPPHKSDTSISSLPVRIKAYKASVVQRVTVGINIVGSANAGKSRLINTLKRVKVRRRNPPFHLRAQAHWQDAWINLLIQNIRRQHPRGQKESSVLLRNVVKPEIVKDPISVEHPKPNIYSPLRDHIAYVDYDKPNLDFDDLHSINLTDAAFDGASHDVHPLPAR
ncbi:hypothetical protein BGY98DRAFT_1181747 [Russula aff. rugulosa BPL654]|nr:hypothetical protein BGY98DRAFT_1181747 [Russula aff. rugulosa BPL654]